MINNKFTLFGLIKEYFDDDIDDELVDSDINYVSEDDIKKRLSNLPQNILLYRILMVDSVKDINTSLLGSHYSTDKNNLIDTHVFLSNKTYYLITVLADKSLIDVKSTVKNNINFPAEKEITLKNKGRGVVIKSITKIT